MAPPGWTGKQPPKSLKCIESSWIRAIPVPRALPEKTCAAAIAPETRWDRYRRLRGKSALLTGESQRLESTSGVLTRRATECNAILSGYLGFIEPTISSGVDALPIRILGIPQSNAEAGCQLERTRHGLERFIIDPCADPLSDAVQ